MRVQQAAFITTDQAGLESVNESNGLEYIANDDDLSMEMMGLIRMSGYACLGVLIHLDSLGINSRAMMPGYHGVIRYMEEQAKYGEVQRPA
ncbi:hypothetical protein BMS3Bbin04_00427 [bacterium BMS3Bbin04]|nr:hypothetical protein BMS3Bbin04_00427 [bacterium BMS3Bbin04]